MKLFIIIKFSSEDDLKNRELTGFMATFEFQVICGRRQCLLPASGNVCVCTTSRKELADFFGTNTQKSFTRTRTTWLNPR